MIITGLGGDLLVSDLDGRIRSLVDASSYGQRVEPWPNRVVDGELARPELRTGVLHSPHGVAVAQDRSIVLTEWLIGGRQVRLRPR